MKAKLTKDSITFSGKKEDVFNFLRKVIEKYPNMTVKEYIDLCNEEREHPERVKV